MSTEVAPTDKPMKLRYVQFATMLFWGLQTDLLLWAIPMAIVWEARFFINRRWSLQQRDFYQIADLTTVFLVGLCIFLYANRTEYHFITALVQWLPILFYPLILILGYSTTDRMSLDVLFYSLRRQKQPVTQTWDMDYFLFGLCIVAAGTNMDGAAFYFPIAAGLVALALLPLRSSRYKINVWVLAVGLMFLAGFMTQTAIRGTHLELKKRVQIWIANWVQQRSNPLKTQTSMGAVGKLKISDEILFRINVPDGGIAPRFLQEASYDLPSGNSWAVMNLKFNTVDHEDDFRWRLIDDDQRHPLDIYLEFRRPQALIPIPAGTRVINDLPAIDIQRNNYGAVKGSGMVPSPRYQVEFGFDNQINGPPDKSDTYVPKAKQALLSNLIATNNLNAEAPLKSLHQFFSDFRYSLYQDLTEQNDPIEHFLLSSQKGHCEYFASATVLLLRQMGIPARYVIGYAVQEYDPLVGMYIVRQRHAHSWAIAFIDNRWQVVDTTPAIWADTESSQSSLIQPALDLLANLNFMYSVWWNDQTLTDYENYLILIGLILGLILAYRIFTSEQIDIKPPPAGQTVNDPALSGNESPLYQLIDRLTQAGFNRTKGELLNDWLKRIGYERYIPMLATHQRWRFDPLGVSNEAKALLVSQVDESIERLNVELDEKTEAAPKLKLDNDQHNLS